MNKLITLLIFVAAFCNGVFAQATSNPSIEMADSLVANGKIYIVVGVLSIVFTCITTYLIILDRKISKLEKSNK